MKRHFITATAVALVLVGCGQGQDTTEEPEQSAASTASASASSSAPTATPTKTAASSPSVTAETPTPGAAAPEQAAPADQPTAEAEPDAAAPESNPVAQFFQTGGTCTSDVWSSSIPYTRQLQQQVVEYCAANKLGDWGYGIDPMDPKNYGGDQSEPEEKSASTEAEEIAKCQALDINTAMSGDIQYCYMEYGIRVD